MRSGGRNRKSAAEKIAAGNRGHRRIAPDPEIVAAPSAASRTPPPSLTPDEQAAWFDAFAMFPTAEPSMLESYARASIMERTFAAHATESTAKFRQWHQCCELKRRLHAELARLVPVTAPPRQKTVEEAQAEQMSMLLGLDDDQAWMTPPDDAKPKAARKVKPNGNGVAHD